MEAPVLKDYGSDPAFGEFEEPSSNGMAVVEVDVAGLNPVDHTIAAGKFPGREPPLREIGEAWNRKSQHRKLVIEVSG